MAEYILFYWFGGFLFACWSWNLRFQFVDWQTGIFSIIVSAFIGPVVGLFWLILHCIEVHRYWVEKGRPP